MITYSKGFKSYLISSPDKRVNDNNSICTIMLSPADDSLSNCIVIIHTMSVIAAALTLSKIRQATIVDLSKRQVAMIEWI